MTKDLKEVCHPYALRAYVPVSTRPQVVFDKIMVKKLIDKIMVKKLIDKKLTEKIDKKIDKKIGCLSNPDPDLW